MAYIDRPTLDAALVRLKGTANSHFRIWLTLKRMGLAEGVPVTLDTTSATNALSDLFGTDGPGGRFFYPFGLNKRFSTMAPDASRSIIQSNIVKFAKGKVQMMDPRAYLNIRRVGTDWEVSQGEAYPRGLGFGPNGFAPRAGTRLTVPLIPFGVWFFRGRDFTPPTPTDPDAWRRLLHNELLRELNLTDQEIALVFNTEGIEAGLPPMTIQTQPAALTADDIREAVDSVVGISPPPMPARIQTLDEYNADLEALGIDATQNLVEVGYHQTDADELLQRVLEAGAKAVLLYGPPRTGKTRAAMRVSEGRSSVQIQIHDGWGYEDLIVGLKPPTDASPQWTYERGALVQAIEAGTEVIILEEVNRTEISQALGEVFSLIEDGYRGPDFALPLKDGGGFYIPDDTLIIMTMNNLDRSTEDVDDALLGRMAAVEFPPSESAARAILDAKGTADPESWIRLYGQILDSYQLGHAYFAALDQGTDPRLFYYTRLRPVIHKHLGGYREAELSAIDSLFDDEFVS